MNQFWNFVGDFFSNEWTITIIGGLLLTGLIKVAEKIYSVSKADKDVRNANKDVIDFLEKVITSKTELSLDFLDSIMNSIARKNNVLIKRMNTKVEAIEDVMVKLYQIDYLSMDEKNDMMKKLINMKLELQKPYVHNVDSLNYNEKSYENKENKVLKSKQLIRDILPLYLSVVGMMVTLMYMLIYTEKNNMIVEPKATDMIVITIFLLIAVIALILLMLTFLEKTKNKRKMVEMDLAIFKDRIKEIRDRDKERSN